MSERSFGMVLYEDERHKFIWLGWDEEEGDSLVQTNQYLIINDGVGVLLDPGSMTALPRVLATVAGYIDLDKVQYIFYTHQDPDVSSGVSIWLENTPAKVYISKLWTRFLPHFGVVKPDRIVPVNDRGGTLKLPSGDELVLVPSHFLHSIGNFSLFDRRSGILFSGDIGAAVFPKNERRLFVENFREHTAYMESFHKRYMVSGKVCKLWAQKVRALSPKLIAPQHGAIFKGPAVEEFLSWFENLKCGIDLLEEIYGG